MSIETRLHAVEEYLKILQTKSQLDYYYPVGSYYETSDADFDPNTAWGGTWSKETKQNVIYKSESGKSIPATIYTNVASITLPAGKDFFVIGNGGCGTNTGVVDIVRRFTITSGTAAISHNGLSSGKIVGGGYASLVSYIKTQTDCTLALQVYLYQGSATGGNGWIAAYPLNNYNDGKITWHRTA